MNLRWPGILSVFALFSAAYADTLTLRPVRTTPLVVPVNGTITLEIRADFDAPLTALQFNVATSGTGAVSATARSANPQQPGGLTYLSRLSQAPFQSGLPHNLKIAPLREVFFDADFDGAPGGATDGLPIGNSVLIETLTLRADQPGEVHITLTDLEAVTTSGHPDGMHFTTTTLDPQQTEITILIGNVSMGDANADGKVDLNDHAQFADCMTAPCPMSGCANPQYSTQNACGIFDSDQDGDVDLEDAGELQATFDQP